MTISSVEKAGIFSFDEHFTVNRLGYGAMQLPGPGIWGPASSSKDPIAVLKKVVELGINFIDTADAYGPLTANQYIKEALYPYEGKNHVFISTKVGLTRQGPNIWTPVGRPAYLRQQVELNLRTLGLEAIDLMFLHRVDREVPLEDQVGELKKMKEEGKIKHIGLSQVSVEEIKAAQKVTSISAVQNLYNVTNRKDEDVLNYAEDNHIAFVPWFPLATGELAQEGSILSELAGKYQAKPSQIALAWLLKRSKVMLPIPGTSSIEHLEENVAAGDISLEQKDFEAINDLT